MPPKEQEVKYVQATTDEEAQERARELQLETEAERQNTKDWANARPATMKKRESIDVGVIEIDKMNLQQKSDMLHNVAIQAEKDLHDAAFPQVIKASEEEVKQDRLK